MRYTPEELEDIVIRLWAQVAALLEFLQNTPVSNGECILGGMERWEKYHKMCQFQEEKIRKKMIL